METYVVAKDSSILAFNKPCIPQQQEENKCIDVYLRIKGEKKRYNEIYEVEDNTLIMKKVGDDVQRKFTFSKILGPDVSQAELFNYVVKSKLLSFFNGKNFSLFTYGASGSGKTFTIVGTPEEPGLIPRAIEYIFRLISKVQGYPEFMPEANGDIRRIDEISKKELNDKKLSIINAMIHDKQTHIRTYRQIQKRLSSEPIAEIENKSDVTVSLWVSFCEIYNEKIYDLLAPPASKAEHREKLNLGRNKENVYIKNLTHINVSDGIEAYQVLQYGLHYLNYAATAKNAHSSRSHCIFTVKLVQISSSQEGVYISNFNFCDLAGSERTKETLNCGVRLKESNNINTSLLVLGRCINNVRMCQQSGDQQLIAFRDSKLTQIFQEALMGHERLDMIVNINPAVTAVNETLHTLNFSAIAKTVVVEELLPKLLRKKTIFTNMLAEQEDTGAANNNNNIKEEESELSSLRKENQHLEEKLKKVQVKVQDTRDDYDNLLAAYETIINERDKLIERGAQLLKKGRENAVLYLTERLAEEKKRHSTEIKRLKEEIEKNNLIVISSSSDEGDSDIDVSPDKTNLRKKSKKELIRLIQDLEQINSRINKLKVGYMEDLIFGQTDLLLEEAEEDNTYWNEEIQRFKHLYRKSKVELVKLTEGVSDDSVYFVYSHATVKNED